LPDFFYKKGALVFKRPFFIFTPIYLYLLSIEKK